MIFGAFCLAFLLWICTKANNFHNAREKVAVCPFCKKTGAKRIMKGTTRGRHECNHCRRHFNF